MSATTYVQRKRTRGWRAPAGAVSCTRVGPRQQSPYGNPLKVGAPYPIAPSDPHALGYDYGHIRDAAHAIEIYKLRLEHSPDLVAQIRRELTGRVLMCWCKPGEPCHVQDVIIPLCEGQLQLNMVTVQDE